MINSGAYNKFKRRVVFTLYVLCATYCFFSLPFCSERYHGKSSVQPQLEKQLNAYNLPNGWKISPIGKYIQTGDLVLNLIPTPDGEHVISLNSGAQQHELLLINIKTATVIQRLQLKNSWMGLTWNPDSTMLYVSGGNNRKEQASIYALSYNPGGSVGNAKLTFTNNPVFAISNDKDDIYWSGLAHHHERSILYAANRKSGEVVVFNSQTGQLISKIKTGDDPYDLVLSGNSKVLYVSNWSSDNISVINTENNTLIATIEVGDNPNDMTISRSGFLYVACANDNSVVIVDLTQNKAVGTILTSMWNKAPEGSTPNFVAFNNKQDKLYVANADNNNLCVIDIKKRGNERVLGFIPTAWYPTAIAISQDGKKLIVGSGKGISSSSNLRGPHIEKGGRRGVRSDEGVHGHISKIITGSIHIFDVPETAYELKLLTKQSLSNSPYSDRFLKRGNKPHQKSIIPSKVGQGSPIKHVIYIIKENRTYDQVFGDIKKGNGDPRIAIFGRNVTPNHHALAEEFVLIDNYYCDGEVSYDAHSWSLAAYATDYSEKWWPPHVGLQSSLPDRTKASEPPSGYIWTLCENAGLTYRSYGMWKWHPSVSGHLAPDYIGWDTNDVENAKAFIKEFDEYERNYDNTDAEKRLPNLSVIWLPQDHTYGGTLGKTTVLASVGANDLGLGMIIERVTHSKYWEQTAIFVTEDDASDGADHVDCHRSILLCISPYTKRGVVDNTHYTTSSILRTIELLLGLPPMSQYDAAATPLYNTMGIEKDLTPYTLRKANINIHELNTSSSYGIEKSKLMNFEEFDSYPMFEYNELIWKTVKGPDSKMPLPIRSFNTHNMK